MHLIILFRKPDIKYSLAIFVSLGREMELSQEDCPLTQWWIGSNWSLPIYSQLGGLRQQSGKLASRWIGSPQKLRQQSGEIVSWWTPSRVQIKSQEDSSWLTPSGSLEFLPLNSSCINKLHARKICRLPSLFTRFRQPEQSKSIPLCIRVIPEIPFLWPVSHDIE